MKHFVLITTCLFSLVLYRLYTFEGTYEVYDPEELEKLEVTYAPVRNYLSSQAEILLPQPQAALLAGMVMGVKEDLPPEFKKALRNTSTIHIVVVSGQNLTLLSVFILSLASVIGRKKAILLSLGLSFGYAVITGLQVPVLRAFLMFAAAAVARLVNREADGFKILIYTGLIMLIYNPSWLFSISFQLSFLATVGVVVVAPEIQRQFKSFPDIIKSDLFTSFSAQLLTLPVIAMNFHQMSLIGVLVNALVLWTIPVVMIFGALAMALNPFLPFVAEIIVLIPNILLTYFIYTVDFFNQKWASVYVPGLGWLVWTGYFMLILAGYRFLKLRNRVMDESDVISLEHVQSKDRSGY